MASRASLLLLLLSASSAATLGVASGGVARDALFTELDRLPVFVLANAGRQPLQYTRDGVDLALFYEDPRDAEAALVEAVDSYPTLGLRLQPTGLGGALRLALDGGRAVLVPGGANLAAAKALPPILASGAEAWGAVGTLPLFGCRALRKPLDDEPGALDAREALAAAAGTDDPASRGLLLEACALSSLAEQLVAGRVDGPFLFVPSRRAARFCAELQSGGSTAAVPPTGSRTAPQIPLSPSGPHNPATYTHRWGWYKSCRFALLA
ncbi:hypothetical protein EMIHUDRAFT_459079 [Emiliania huxleyi CCMP1516]|uniref:Uncharacterized protein n=2 Tax=Emiliania huxleyi TaxID=2903 RepID=A0A0D3J086_EMIH1|nr:hypothetical protein EMIHUDRAFT_459079 [Emiliania huxleyi CCMP1516]EOD16921.1 hypothetical protein EMIHUDRAFT_459079 [Emiliania huxleyi CCMP1516]|eukprot:XP_005769350.1 hypothetical protein EMIHUDRAFT_459079 [Emiliania huxleyi CCMP1516]